MVIHWDRGVVWNNWFRIRNIRTVNLEFDFRGGRHGIGRDQIFHWVIEAEFLDFTGGSDRLLCLCDEHVLWCIGKRRAFIGIEVEKLSEYFEVSDNRGMISPCNSQFNIVVLKCNQWDRG